MKELRVKEMEIQNFKGIEKLTLTPKKYNKIVGENATGKTSVFHAFSWLLTGKNIDGDAKFIFTPLDKKGNVIYGSEPLVRVDFGDFAIQKILQEKWTKETKEKKSEFNGYSIQYSYEVGDEIKICKKSEFESFIESNIGDSYKIEILSSTDFFSNILHWTDKRNILIERIDDIDKIESDILKKDKQFKTIADIQDKSKEQDKLKSQKANLEKEKKEVETRIKEVKIGFPEEEVLEDKDILEKYAQKNKEREDISKEYLQKYDSFIDKVEELKKQELDLSVNSNSGDKEVYKDLKNAEKDTLNKKGERSKLKKSLEEYSGLFQTQEDINKALETARKQYGELLRKNEPDEKICSKCGQDLPLSIFKEKKDKTLDHLKRKGEGLKLEEDTIREEIDKVQREITLLDSEIIQLERVEKKLRDKYNESLKTNKAEGSINKLKEEIAKIDIKMNEFKKERNDKITKIDIEILDVSKIMESFDKYKEKKDRLNVLSEKLSKIDLTLGEIKERLKLLESFIILRCEDIEKRVNKLFKMANFKLFNVFLNGNIEECCDTVFNGVPFKELNTGSKVLVGLDIIYSMSEFYNISLPVFVDNTESITSDFENGQSQLFLLKAENNVDKLKVISSDSIKGVY